MLHHPLLVSPELVDVEAVDLFDQVRVGFHEPHHVPSQMGLGCAKNSSYTQLHRQQLSISHVSTLPPTCGSVHAQLGPDQHHEAVPLLRLFSDGPVNTFG